jgi:hypothetical protein
MASMEGLIAGGLADALLRGRDRFNTKFAYARRIYPSLDPDVFKEHLLRVVSPIADAVAAVAPGRLDAVVSALYDVSLDLIGKGLLGNETRYPALTKSWSQLFTSLPHLLASDPRRVAGAVSNAIYNLSVVPTARPTFWIDAMLAIGRGSVEVESFLEAGKVIAWRSGMAHYREGAIVACRNLEPELARAALGVPATNTSDISMVLEKLMADPWLAPASAGLDAPARKALRLVSAVGAFRGFGGDFERPPKVTRSDGQFFVYDGENCWTFTADLFGATLHRQGPKATPAKNEDGSSFEIDKRGRVTKGDYAAVFAEVADWTSFASNEHTLAVTIPVSHSVYLIALTTG